MRGIYYIPVRPIIMTIIIFFQFHNNLYSDEYHTNIIISGAVNIQNGTPLVGETVVGKIDVSYIQEMPEHEFYIMEILTSQSTTIGDGRFTISFDIEGTIYNLRGLDVMLQNRENWLTIAKEQMRIDDSHYEFTVTVMALADDDKNGIHDAYEYELAKKFCPSLVPVNEAFKICPEPVQIVGGQHNSKIYATWTRGKEKVEDFLGVPLDRFYLEDSPGSNNFIPVIREFGNNFDSRIDYSFINEYSIELLPNHRVMVMTPDKKFPLYVDYFHAKSHIWFHFDWPRSTTHEWFVEYNTERLENNFHHTIYCTVWEEPEPGYLFNNYIPVIQYWFFYPYDDWANDHEGDWEHINVLVTSQLPLQAQLESVQFYFHEFYRGWNYQREPYSLDVDDGTHVTVYVGGEALNGLTTTLSPYGGMNSNGSYPKPVIWKNVGFKNFSYVDIFTNYWDDFASGYGKKIFWSEIVCLNDPGTYVEEYGYNPAYYSKGRGLILLKDANYWQEEGFFKQYPQYSWVRANILAGEPSQVPGIPFKNPFKGYPGPWRKDNWRKLGGAGGERYYQ